MPKCSICKKEKKFSYPYRCPECNSKYMKEWYKKNKDKHKKLREKFKENNPNYYKERKERLNEEKNSDNRSE